MNLPQRLAQLLTQHVLGQHWDGRRGVCMDGGRGKEVSEGSEVGEPKAGVRKPEEPCVRGAGSCVGEPWEVSSAGAGGECPGFCTVLLHRAASLSWLARQEPLSPSRVAVCACCVRCALL